MATIRTKLELMSGQEDCPICYETFCEAVPGLPVEMDEHFLPAETLGCCHKVCKPCWKAWCEACGGGHAICPLCRHDEFVSAVVRHPRRRRSDPPPLDPTFSVERADSDAPSSGGF